MAEAAARAPLEILLIEDNPADVRMTREALGSTSRPHQLHVVEDGEAALAFLRRRGEFAGAPRPDLILLDLSLPRLNGHALLAELRGVPLDPPVPVVVLTGSRQEKDLARSFELAADAHITKPATLLQFTAELMFALSLARPRAA